MDTPFTQTAEVSALTVTPPTFSPSTILSIAYPASSWVKSAVHLSRPKQRGQFSRYQLGEARKAYVPPVWLTKPDPEKPVRLKRHREPNNPMIAMSNAWYREWRNRDWDAAAEFFKASDPDEQPKHEIIRQA